MTPYERVNGITEPQNRAQAELSRTILEKLETFVVIEGKRRITRILTSDYISTSMPPGSIFTIHESSSTISTASRKAGALWCTDKVIGLPLDRSSSALPTTSIAF